jgi:hypothetical protein
MTTVASGGNSMRKHFLFGLALFFAIASLAIAASGQGFPELDMLTAYGNHAFVPAHTALQQSEQGSGIGMPASQPPLAAAGAAPHAAGSAVAVMPGTHVLMALTSPLHSISGTEGSGVYLEVVAPVVQQDRVIIPARTYVQGIVEGNRRPGHFNRGSEFRIRFTTMIFPNNSVTAIDGMLQSVPGSKTRSRGQGTIRTVDQTEQVLLPAAVGAVGGAILGSVSRFGIGTFIGAGLGAGFGAGGVLLQRGDEINLPAGTRMEMVLRSEIMLSPGQANFNAAFVAPPSVLAAPQPESSAPAPTRHHRHSPFLPLF